MKPLREQGPQAAKRLAEVNDAFAPTPGEQAAAWARLRDRLPGLLPADQDRRGYRQQQIVNARRTLRLRLRLFWSVGAVAVLGAVLWLIIGPGWPGRTGDRPAPPLVSRGPGAPALPLPAPEPAPRAPAPREIAQADTPPAGGGEAATALPLGRSLLTAGVRARLAPRGVARVLPASVADARTVALERGTLDIEIDPARARAPAAGVARESSPRVAVQVASYRVEAEGGRFSVSTQRGKIDLVVHSGKLVVWSSRRVVAQVVAGEGWTNLPSPTLSALAAAPGRAGSGRSHQDDDDNRGGDQTARAAAPEATRPAGTEAADCARLTRRGAIDDALTCFGDEARQPGLVGELALMELARIRRDVKGDLVGAERALAEHRRRFPHGSLADEAAGERIALLVRLGRATEALAESEALAGSDGIFWRAVCLGRLGRREEAARAIDAYLAHSDGKHRAEATRMRRELTPP